ncbi:MAG: cupin domain-containing protein, partial [Paludibacterium sp.]|uniref:cupin domain-containing protein n=1 Tax=Paludibacterium sp. TaxID=1917523 RepID=UPI0025D5A283
MDTLSTLLALTRAHVALDARCLLGSRFTLPHAPLPPGEATFHLVLAGQCRLHTASGEAHLLSPGCLALLPHGVGHSVTGLTATRPDDAAPRRSDDSGALPFKRQDGDHTVDLLCGRLIHDANAAKLLLANVPSLLVAHLDQTPGLAALETLAALLRAESAANLPGAAAILTALMQALLGYALRDCADRPSSAPHCLALVTDPRLGAATQAMLRAPEQPWTLESLADRAAMSRATFARRFRERAGMTPGDFLTALRMTLACRLLRDSPRPLADIAAAVGYQSDTAFGKAFRQSLGTRPGQ